MYMKTCLIMRLFILETIQINDVFGAHDLGIKPIWFNNKNDEWSQSFDKPDEFSNWNDCTKLIGEIDAR